MPTFYEGAPILEATFKIEKDLYVESLYKVETNKNFFAKKEIKAGICIATALLFAVNIPNYLRNYGNFIVPVIIILACFLCAWFFASIQPSEIRKLYEKKYETNKLLSLSQKVTLYRDSMIYENEFEKFSLYYTDFDLCFEDDKVIVLCGAKRDFLLINKESLTNAEKEKTSESLKNAFAAKYKRVK